MLGWFRHRDERRLRLAMKKLDRMSRQIARTRYPTNKWKLIKRVFGRLFGRKAD